MAIVVGGLAKLFVGELVETSTEVLGNIYIYTYIDMYIYMCICIHI
jgi:hypothetical protein